MVLSSVFLSNAQDVSRLVDLCRQSIIFEKVEDLVECLRIISADSLVRVVQVTILSLSPALRHCSISHLQLNTHALARPRIPSQPTCASLPTAPS